MGQQRIPCMKLGLVSWSLQPCFPIHRTGMRDLLLTVSMNDAQHLIWLNRFPSVSTWDANIVTRTEVTQTLPTHMTPFKWGHAGYQTHSSFPSRRKPQEDLQPSLTRVAARVSTLQWVIAWGKDRRENYLPHPRHSAQCCDMHDMLSHPSNHAMLIEHPLYARYCKS